MSVGKDLHKSWHIFNWYFPVGACQDLIKAGDILNIPTLSNSQNWQKNFPQSCSNEYRDIIIRFLYISN